jgi:Tol biopolymer transport system component
MKNIKTLGIFILLAFLILSCQESEKSNLTLLSDEIPTDIPLVFGEGIVSMDEAMDFAITFSPEMDEMYFTRRKPGGRNNILTSKLVDGSWTTPQLAFFSSNGTWEFEPHINPTGDRLYFGSTRPINDTLKSPGLIQWYSERKNSRWSEPLPLEKPSAATYMMYLTSSAKGNLYFTSQEEGAKPENGGIYYAMAEAGGYSDVQKMGNEINNGKMIAHSYIAPDESYMIFDGERPSGFGDSDLYISFKRNGSWTEAYNLGSKINTEQTEMAASVSPDGRYLFFHRGFEMQGEDDGSEWLGNIYWVDFMSVKESIKKSKNNN